MRYQAIRLLLDLHLYNTLSLSFELAGNTYKKGLAHIKDLKTLSSTKQQ